MYTVSGNSSQEQSDSEAETGVEVTTLPDPVSAPKSTTGVLKPSTLGQTNSQVDPLLNSTAFSGSGAGAQNFQGQRSRTPGPNDLGKENLANRYKINKTPDRDVKLRQRLSKTPDREIGASRRYSFSASKRLSKSCDSLESSGNDSRDQEKSYGTDPFPTKKKGKLKDHRRKGKRAATVHTLDTDQLLLILNLQMRYLQETSEQQANNTNNTINASAGSRRAITPQPVSQRPSIPQKVRSHTPQPRRSNRVAREQAELQFYSQRRGRNPSLTQGISSENSSRRTSESSEKNFDFINGKHFVGKGLNSESGSYLHSQQISKSAQNNPQPYNPYIQSQVENSPADNVHFVTYSDSMLCKNPNKPKSRASAQENILPSKPLHRGSNNQLPPQPISRQRNADRQLPRQPVHRGSSAFHIVDRNSKSRSPSVASDKIANSRESSKHKQGTDYAEYAIRDNFSMNPKQFILTESQQEEMNPNTKRNQQNVIQNPVNGNFMMKAGASAPVEHLPPYSGPPSYREYVSSCNTSVTSSLSSNPDDVYSMPKRRVKTELESLPTSEPSGTIFSVVSQRIENSSRHGNGIPDSNIYGNAEIISDNLVHQESNPSEPNSENKVRGQGHHSVSQGHSVSQIQGQEVIYSSPAKSKVKQYIVPEDYYSSVCNVRRHDNVPVRQVNVPVSTDGVSNVLHQKIKSEYNENIAKPAMYNMNRQQTFAGQIAPDAKYNDYEDVYDSSKSVHESLPQSTCPSGANSYSVNTHGISCANVTPYIISSSGGDELTSAKVNPLQKSAPKHQTGYPVSNVHANMDFMNDSSGCYGNQPPDSVGNVHASNLNKIPCIKLNDREVDHADDDVFLDNSNVYKSRVSSQWSDQNYPENCPDVIQVQSDKSGLNNPPQKHDYQEINDFEPASQNSVPGLVTSETVIESDAEYMKMTLPGKDSVGHNLSDPTNQMTVSDHVTSISANQSLRPKPDGIDKVSDEEESYAETGV